MMDQQLAITILVNALLFALHFILFLRVRHYYKTNKDLGYNCKLSIGAHEPTDYVMADTTFDDADAIAEELKQIRNRVPRCPMCSSLDVEKDDGPFHDHICNECCTVWHSGAIK